jgi:hypothetical protein
VPSGWYRRSIVLHGSVDESLIIPPDDWEWEPYADAAGTVDGEGEVPLRVGAKVWVSHLEVISEDEQGRLRTSQHRVGRLCPVEQPRADSSRPGTVGTASTAQD